jgi:hypothetical protein
VFEIDAEVELTERGPRITPLRPLREHLETSGGADPVDRENGG